MDMIQNTFVERLGFDFFGSPTTGVNTIDTKFVVVENLGGKLQNTYTGVVQVQNGYA